MYVYLNNKLESEYSRLSLWYFVSFILGIAFYFSLSCEPSIWIMIYFIIFCIPLVFLGFFTKTNRMLWQFLLYLLVAFIFGIVIGKYRVFATKTVTIDNPIISTVTGEIDSIKPTTSGIYIILKSITGPGLPHLQKVKINLPEKYKANISDGDTIKIRAKLYPPQTRLLPNSYDFGMYAFLAQIGATGYAMSHPSIIMKFSQSQSAIASIRHNIYYRLIDVMGKDEGNFAAAMSLAETNGINKDIMKNMRTAGISHILCVSGLHLSLVAMLLFITMRLILNLSDYIAFNFNIKLLSSISALIGSFAYLLLTNAPVAATRAFIMTSIFLLAITIERSVYPIRSLGIASFVILCLNPEYVFHPSFQLSFIAVLSLIAGYEFYQKNQWILGKSKGIFASIRFYLISNIYSSFLASIVTAPVVISQFYIFSTYSIIANLIAVPITSFFIMPLLILGIILMPFGADKFIFLLLKPFIRVLIDLSYYINTLPGAVWYFGYITSCSITLFLLGFFWLCLWQTNWRIYGVLVISVSLILMANSPKPDLIFDPIFNVVGLKNKQNKLEIYADKITEFNKTQLANWFGQKEVKVMPLTSNEFITNSGNKVIINYNNNTLEEVKSDTILTIQDIKKTSGDILIFCDKSLCSARTENGNRFK